MDLTKKGKGGGRMERNTRRNSGGRRSAAPARRDRERLLRGAIVAGVILVVAVMMIAAAAVNRGAGDAEAWGGGTKAARLCARQPLGTGREQAEQVRLTAPKVTGAPYDLTLCFAGDVSLADGSVPLQAYQSNGIDCIGASLLERMQGADFFCLNSEFAFTTGGTRIEKNYNFRGDPARISVYDKMGVDLAILANNHVFDYGEVGLADTLNTFREHGLPYVGAGENLEEASAIYYAELENCTVAFIAGNRVEWEEQTRGATEDRSGVFRTAESNALICQRIAEAKETADFVVVYIHWGMENVEWQEDYQLTSGKEFIDAGADVVVGDHPHVVQGIEWYEGKPIFYSLGNFWFSSYERYTMLLEIDLDRDEAGDARVGFRLVPGWTGGGRTNEITDGAKRENFFDYMESISVNAAIDSDGTVREA